ncbi:hypothetical protein ID866_8101 [Astraeus odoratus]|nr:hypothetical protein ID866_8101 [Astraeus odoratus]
MFVLLLAISLIGGVLYGYSIFGSKRSHPSYPPRVHSIVPWIGSALSYISSPSEFLEGCQARYGSVYKFLVGGQNIVVVSSQAALSSIYSVDTHALGSHVTHNQIFQAVTGRKGNMDNVHHTMVNLIFPLVDRYLSRRALGELTQPLAQALHDRVIQCTAGQNTHVSLMWVFAEPLYFASNVVLFGRKFPCDTYGDFRTLDISMPERFFGVPFWFWPSDQARRRLVQRFAEYLSMPDSCDEPSPLGPAFRKLIQDNNISLDEAADHMLAFQWGMQSNTTGTLPWLFMFLLSHPAAMSAVREEIDKAIKNDFGDLQTFLAKVNPKVLERPSFKLLTSALLEAMRLIAVFAALRVAEHDLELKDQATTIPVRKGEYVMGNVRAIHLDANTYPNCNEFVFDRFAHGEHREGRLPTDGQPWYSFGGGKHLCRGRYLAVYEMKLLAIFYLYLFDITPVTQGWWPPKTTKRNLGLPRAEDMVVELRARHTV